MQRAADVYGSQDGEYETLDEAHTDFEGGESGEADERAEPGERLDDEAGYAAEQLGERSNGEHAERDQQDVAGQHVGEQTDGVAEWASNEDREELDEAHEAAHDGVLDSWRPHDVFEVGGAVVLDTDGDEHHPDGECKQQRPGHAGVARHVEERNDLEEVADEDEEEQCRQQRHIGLVAVTDTGLGDLLFDELDDAFGEHPDLRWVISRAAPSHHEDDGWYGKGDQRDQRDLVELENGSVAKDRRPVHQVLCWREWDG